ncbi:helix-turn-helix domain-containing protein [Streptomyces sp. NPDC047939]|uniref:helix-turn-helix domain-containing protein n=1 Tax=Streptomyces sp. NPDC047939 TaxID=3155381 RepID=UPI00343EA6B9
MTDTADEPTRVTGDEAKRIKREALGITDRKKHHGRAATAIKRRAKEPGTQQRVYRYRFYPDPTQAEQLEKTLVPAAGSTTRGWRSEWVPGSGIGSRWGSLRPAGL